MKHETQLAMCEGKHKQSRAVAKKAAKSLRKKGHAVSEYKCQCCGTWHVGATDFAKDAPLPDDGKKVRPTPQRQSRGQWVAVGGKAAVERYVRDVAAHPIDALEHTGQISKDQADAGRQFERLYRAQSEMPGIRDSTTLFEPRGHDETDGPVEYRAQYRELCRNIGMQRDRALIAACVTQIAPKNDREMGVLREALNEAERFFGHRKKSVDRLF